MKTEATISLRETRTQSGFVHRHKLVRKIFHFKQLFVRNQIVQKVLPKSNSAFMNLSRELGVGDQPFENHSRVLL